MKIFSLNNFNKIKINNTKNKLDDANSKLVRFHVLLIYSNCVFSASLKRFMNIIKAKESIKICGHPFITIFSYVRNREKNL